LSVHPSIPSFTHISECHEFMCGGEPELCGLASMDLWFHWPWWVVGG
jgi:hypothetical protein